MSIQGFEGKKVLITGGLGFIGSNLARRLVDAGAHVTVVDNLIPGCGGNLYNIDRFDNKIKIHVLDIRNSDMIKSLVECQDFLFNLAGQTSHLDSMKNPTQDLEINCTAQLSILEACRLYNKTIKIVFTSTRQVYGRPDYLPVNEEHPVRPVDVNGINKMTGEWYHILYNNVYTIQTSILRLTNTIGPRMRIKDARQTFLGIWIRKLLEGEPIEVWGGEQQRDFNYVDDCVDALCLAMNTNSTNKKIFNLGSNEKISLKALAEMLIKINGSGEYIIKPFPVEREKIDIGDYYSDYKLIRKTVGWEPKITLKEGLIRTLNFYKRNFKHYV